jgi:hypothetical protein
VANLKSAHRLGLGTVWMQQYLKYNPHGHEVGTHLHGRPPFVCQNQAAEVAPRLGRAASLRTT